jgi:hypothetical protein
MGKHRYGITSFKVHNIDPANGLALAGSELDITASIFRDSFDLQEEEGTETELYNEMDTTPEISFTEPGKETLSFQLMDTQVDTIKEFLGGEVVEVPGTSKTWSKPLNAGVINKYVEIETQDGYKLIIYKGKVAARKNFQLRRNNIWLLDVTITPQKPDFPALAPMDIVEPLA